MTMLNPQLMTGLAVGLLIWSLMSKAPLLRDVLSAVAAAAIADVLIGRQSAHDVGSIIERISGAISVHPQFTLGVILAATAATIVSRFAQQVGADQ